MLREFLELAKSDIGLYFAGGIKDAGPGIRTRTHVFPGRYKARLLRCRSALTGMTYALLISSAVALTSVCQSPHRS